ncbi:MAG: hypothetical protein ACP5OP_05650 [Leptospirillia bacterium]
MNPKNLFRGLLVSILFLGGIPETSVAGVLPGPDTVIESRILWVENQMRMSMSRFHQLFLQKNRGNDFYATPMLPPVPVMNLPAPVEGTGVSGVSQSAAEGMGQAVSGLPQVPTAYASGSRVHDMAYQASPEGALRLGADMEGRMFQTLVTIHQDLLYLLKVQSSRSGLKGQVLDQNHYENLRDQEILKIDLPQWIMYR